LSQALTLKDVMSRDKESKTLPFSYHDMHPHSIYIISHQSILQYSLPRWRDEEMKSPCHSPTVSFPRHALVYGHVEERHTWEQCSENEGRE